ncbi:MAG: hypothetical protein U9O53_04205 [archaeon]|nr:hypothetical protein [archaeon]
MVDLAAIPQYLGEYLQPLGEYSLYLILLFIIVVIVAVKITKMLFGMFIAAVLGGLFPFIVNDFLKIYGLVEPGIFSSLTFAFLGVIIYGAYSILTFLYGVAKVAGKAAFFPLRILAFIGDATVKAVSFVGYLIIAPFRFIAKVVSERESKEKKEVDDDDDDFWKKREESSTEEYEGVRDISVDKTEERIHEDVSSDSKDSFFSKVYADYEKFEKDKKEKKD